MLLPISNFAVNDESLVKRYANDAGCCNDYPDVCAYEITIPTSATVNNIKFKRNDGSAEVTKTFTATGGSAVVAALKSAFASEGYEDDGDEVKGITSKVSGSNTIYTIVGSLVVVSMTHSTSTVVSAVKKCKRTGVCDFVVNTAAGAVNNFRVDATTVDLGNLPFSSTTAAALKTAIEGASNFPSGYTVDVVKGATEFTITITGPSPKLFAWNSVQFSKQNCQTMYTA